MKRDLRFLTRVRCGDVGVMGLTALLLVLGACGGGDINFNFNLNPGPDPDPDPKPDPDPDPKPDPDPDPDPDPKPDPDPDPKPDPDPDPDPDPIPSLDYSLRDEVLPRATGDVLRLPHGHEDRALLLDHGSRYTDLEVTYRFYTTSEGESDPGLVGGGLSEDRYRAYGGFEGVEEEWLKGVFRKALDGYASVSGLTFREVKSESSDISYFLRDFNSGLLGYSNYPPGSKGVLDKDLVEGGRSDPVATLLQETVFHELGHGLGLRHPFRGSSYGSRGVKQLEGYDATTAYTSLAYRDMPFSVYFDGTEEKVRFRDGLGLYDVKVIQDKYGVNRDYKSGDTVYDAAYFEKHWIQRVIWDGGGRDKIDLSGFRFTYLEAYGNKEGKALPTPRHEIDLEPGYFGAVGIIERGFLPQDRYFRGYDNVVIAYGAVIEDAVGGDGDDVLRGNGVGNVLMGRGGDDVLMGRGGDDELTGGAGADRLYGGEGQDVAVYEGESSLYGVKRVSKEGFMVWKKGGVDVDLVVGVESLRFSDGDKVLADIAEASDGDVEGAPYGVAGVGGVFAGVIGSTGDEDWLRLDLVGNGPRLSLSIDGGGKIEGVYDDYKAGGNKVVSSGFGSVGVSKSGDYYAKIVHEGSGGGYNVSVDEVSGLPDLLIRPLSLLAKAFYAGSLVYFDITLENKGTGYASPTYVKHYLSEDETWDKNDSYLGLTTFDWLAGGMTRTKTTGQVLLNYQSKGKYYLVSRVDTDREIEESNEGNNDSVTSFTVGDPLDGDRHLGILSDGEVRVSDGLGGGDSDTFGFTLEKASHVGLFFDRTLYGHTGFSVYVRKLGGEKLAVPTKPVAGAEYGQNYVSGENLYNGLYRDVEAGEYEVVVSGRDSVPHLTYQLSVTAFGAEEGNRADDYSADVNSVGEVNVNGALRGVIERVGDEDWIKVHLETDVRYKVYTGGQGYGRGSLADPKIVGVKDSEGKDVTANVEKASFTRDSEIEALTVGEDGDYYVVVGSGDNGDEGVGSYWLYVVDNNRDTSFSTLRTKNSVADVEVKSGDTGSRKILFLEDGFHHYYYAVDGKRDVFSLERVDGDDKSLPTWLVIDGKSGDLTLDSTKAREGGEKTYEFRLEYSFVPDGAETVYGADIFKVRVREDGGASIGEEVWGVTEEASHFW